MSSSGLPLNPRPPWSARPHAETLALLSELKRKKMDALSVYQPLPFQERYHACKAQSAILMKSNRAGGSLAGFMEDARAVRCCDPHDKYDKSGGLLVCLGYGEGHVGRVIHRYLFRSGAFSIIQDEKTKEWRTFRPWHRDEEFNGMKGDKGREKESLPAPPLIPKHLIKGRIAWVKRAHYIFSQVELTTGWTIYACNSAGDSEQAQGFSASLYHIDEDLARPDWYHEALGRIVDKGGYLRWTAMPHSKNQEMVDMVNLAEAEKGKENPAAVLITATIYDNPYLPKQSVDQIVKIWKSMGEDVYRQRALGQLTMDSVLMYPEFDKKVHDYRSHSTPECESLQKNGGLPPDDWCLYMSVDPGNTVCAVTYWAVPPSQNHVYMYDESYLLGANAKVFGDAVYEKIKDKAFQAFIMDKHGGNLRDLGSGWLPRELYSKQLEARGLRSVETNYDFLDGCDDLFGRETIMRDCLRLRDDGSPYLIINTDRCTNFCLEMPKFKKQFKEIGGRKYCTDKGDRKYDTHAIETAEYAVAHGLPYVQPPKSVMKMTWAERMIQETAMRRRMRQMQSGEGSSITLGPQGVSA